MPLPKASFTGKDTKTQSFTNSSLCLHTEVIKFNPANTYRGKPQRKMEDGIWKMGKKKHPRIF